MRKLGQDGVTPTDRKVALISLDSFYKVLTPEESKAAYAGAYNFDRPGTAETDKCAPAHSSLTVTRAHFFHW